MTGIYKAYDIRGIYPSELDEDTAYNIGRAFVQFLKVEEGGQRRKTVISKDI